MKQLPRPIPSLGLKSNAHRCPLCKTEKLLTFFVLIYLWHAYTSILYKHPHVQIHIHLASTFIWSSSHILEYETFTPYLANFVVTGMLPFLLIETFTLLYFSPGEKQCGGKPWKTVREWSSKLLNTSMREECEICGGCFFLKQHLFSKHTSLHP